MWGFEIWKYPRADKCVAVIALRSVICVVMSWVCSIGGSRFYACFMADYREILLPVMNCKSQQDTREEEGGGGGSSVGLTRE